MYYYGHYDDRDEEKIAISKARTNRLKCSECKKKIQKGDKVIFVLEVDFRERTRMKDCYCEKCGKDIEDAQIEAQAFADAFGLVGQD